MDAIRLFDKLNLKAARLFTILSRRAFGSFGRGSLLWYPNYLINPERIFIGSRVRVMARCWIMPITQWAGYSYGGEIYIEDDTIIGFDVQISACTTMRIGKSVGIGRGSVVADHIHDYRKPGRAITYEPITEGEPITIENGVFIGANCIISPGVCIGRNTFVGAGSVVIGDIPPQSMAAGNPARVIRQFDTNTGKWKKC